MERESFENEEVAEVLNRDFVSIKVDREERPDIDSIYMNVCQALTGSGGWPLTIIMTPEKQPFFAATYLPRTSRAGLNGLMELLPKFVELWSKERLELVRSAQEIGSLMQQSVSRSNKDELNENILHLAFNNYRQSFDASWGGFSRSPKFPASHNLLFLLRYYHYQREPEALHMVETTLQHMYQGGIYDHIGFGFSRYSTDRYWLVPHFEKMLYDNALLAMAYLEAFQVTGNNLYARAAREIFTYVLRDMTSLEGGFYSAEDADSEGEEGEYYLWKQSEVLSILGEKDGFNFCEMYGITEAGNFEGKNIPNFITRLIDEKERENLETSRIKLFNYRNRREHPFKDDKILTAWNALMISALAMGFRVLGDDKYLDAARDALSFVLQKLRRQDGRLLVRYRDGEAMYNAYLDDYAYLIWALIEIYQASYDLDYIRIARQLNDDMLKHFWDEQEGGLFFYGSDSEKLPGRPKEIYDGALPSGNSVAAMNLLRLSRLTAEAELEVKAWQQIQCFAGNIRSTPTASSFMLMALLFALDDRSEVVIAGKKDDDGTKQMIKAINRLYVPDTITMAKFIDDKEAAWQEWPNITDKQMINEKATAYICRNYACEQPVTSADALISRLAN